MGKPSSRAPVTIARTLIALPNRKRSAKHFATKRGFEVLEVKAKYSSGRESGLRQYFVRVHNRGHNEASHSRETRKPWRRHREQLPRCRPQGRITDALLDFQIAALFSKAVRCSAASSQEGGYDLSMRDQRVGQAFLASMMPVRHALVIQAKLVQQGRV
jgi:hypothetical protein